MTPAPDQRLPADLSLIARCSNPRSANPAPLGLVVLGGGVHPTLDLCARRWQRLGQRFGVGVVGEAVEREGRSCVGGWAGMRWRFTLCWPI